MSSNLVKDEFYTSFIGNHFGKNTFGQPEYKESVITFVWLLSSDLPQPVKTIGLWTDDDVWSADAIWYS